MGCELSAVLPSRSFPLKRDGLSSQFQRLFDSARCDLSRHVSAKAEDCASLPCCVETRFRNCHGSSHTLEKTKQMTE